MFLRYTTSFLLFENIILLKIVILTLTTLVISTTQFMQTMSLESTKTQAIYRGTLQWGYR